MPRWRSASWRPPTRTGRSGRPGLGDEVRGIGTHASRHGVSAVVGVRCVAEGREVAVRGVRERVLVAHREVVALPVRELVNARSADAVGEVADAERLVVVSVGAGISERLVAAVDRLDTGDHGHGVLFGERVVEVQLVADREHVVAGAALVEEPPEGRLAVTSSVSLSHEAALFTP